MPKKILDPMAETGQVKEPQPDGGLLTLAQGETSTPAPGSSKKDPGAQLRGFMKGAGLELPQALTYPEWEQFGSVFRRITTQVTWALADWLNFGEKKFGESYAQAIDITGFDYQYLADVAWVGRVFPLFARRENLPFSYHRETANKIFDDEDRTLLLGKAVLGKTEAGSDMVMRRDAFRALVKEYRKQKALPDPQESQPQWTGGKFGAAAESAVTVEPSPPELGPLPTAADLAYPLFGGIVEILLGAAYTKDGQDKWIKGVTGGYTTEDKAALFIEVEGYKTPWTIPLDRIRTYVDAPAFIEADTPEVLPAAPTQVLTVETLPAALVTPPAAKLVLTGGEDNEEETDALALETTVELTDASWEIGSLRERITALETANRLLREQLEDLAVGGKPLISDTVAAEKFEELANEIARLQIAFDTERDSHGMTQDLYKDAQTELESQIDRFNDLNGKYTYADERANILQIKLDEAKAALEAKAAQAGSASQEDVQALVKEVSRLQSILAGTEVIQVLDCPWGALVRLTEGDFKILAASLKEYNGRPGSTTWTEGGFLGLLLEKWAKAAKVKIEETPAAKSVQAGGSDDKDD